MLNFPMAFFMFASRSQPITWLQLCCVYYKPIITWVFTHRHSRDYFVLHIIQDETKGKIWMRSYFFLSVFCFLFDASYRIIFRMYCYRLIKTKVKSYNAINWNLGSEKLFNRANLALHRHRFICCHIAVIWYCQNHCHAKFNESIDSKLLDILFIDRSYLPPTERNMCLK